MKLNLNWDQRTNLEDFAEYLYRFLDNNNLRENLTESVIDGLVKSNRKPPIKGDVVDIAELLKKLEKTV